LNGPQNLTVRDVLTLSTDFLERKGSPSARLDAQLLIAHVLGVRRLDLYLSPERPITDHERDTLRALLVRRGNSEPVAYLIGRREFFGMDFHVTPAVLIPRPETESIVDAALVFLSGPEMEGREIRVADIGTGSGAIACAIAARVPAARITATEISPSALDVAAGNAVALGVADRITFVRADILDAVTEPTEFDLIISNPPYIAESEADITDASARLHEPRGALFSGPDGTDCTFELVERAGGRLAQGGMLIIETGTPRQTGLVAERLRERFDNVTEVTDPGGNVRGLKAFRGANRRTESQERAN